MLAMNCVTVIVLAKLMSESMRTNFSVMDAWAVIAQVVMELARMVMRMLVVMVWLRLEGLWVTWIRVSRVSVASSVLDVSMSILMVATAFFLFVRLC